METQDLLAAAHALGLRIAGQAVAVGDSCTWTVLDIDRSAPGSRLAVPRLAGGELYQGSAGIAWFLAEVAAATDDACLRRAAEAGFRHALQAAEAMPLHQFGFHSGRVGVAWALERASRLLGEPSLRVAAWGLLEAQLGGEDQESGLDIISGGAGAIPALLDLASSLERPELVESARRLGEGLLRRARREPGGWCWRTMTDSVVRYLNGLAHGASGFGLAFLELARATGLGRYRFAAEMAFLYERQFFDEEASNWPDLRNQGMGDMAFYGQGEELRQLARSGQAPAYRPHFMTAWCHGSPGIGLARLRAFELTGAEIYRREAYAALRSTTAHLAPEALAASNFSLCHGHCGNGELPLMVGRQWRDEAALATAREVARQGLERWQGEAAGWPCGTISQESDPSLMLGEAGIGLYLLRLADASIPTPLLLRPPVRELGAEPSPTDDDSFVALAQEAVAEYFGGTRAAWKRLGGPAVAVPGLSIAHQPLTVSPVVATFEALERALEQVPELAPASASVPASAEDPAAEDPAAEDPAAEDPSLRRQWLEDAFRVERQRYLETLALTDFTEQTLRQWARVPWQELTPEEARWRRAPGCRPVEVRWDWPPWVARDGALPPPEAEALVLLFRAQDHIGQRSLPPFPGLILELLAKPRSLTELVAEVALALEGSAEPESLRTLVLEQVAGLYRAGWIDALPAPEAGEEPP